MIFNMTLSEQGSLAELTNIRIGADGTNYPTAGDAVRGQVTGLKEDFSSQIIDINKTIYATGSALTPYGTTTGKKLTKSGVVDDANYKVEAFAIASNVGKPLKIVSDDRFLFANTYSLGSAYTYITSPVFSNGEYYLTIPATSKMLFVSTPINDSSVAVYFASKIKVANDEIDNSAVATANIQDGAVTMPKTDFAKAVPTENLFNKDKHITGENEWYYVAPTVNVINFTPTSASGYDAIKIPISDTYSKLTFAIFQTLRYIYGYYMTDESGNILSRATNISATNYTADIPTGAKFLLLSARTMADWDYELMVCYGESASTYKPYSEKIYLDDYEMAQKSNVDADVLNLQNQIHTIVPVAGSILKLPNKIDMVAGYPFEMFFKGLCNAVKSDDYEFDITFNDTVISNSKGWARKYTAEPVAGNVGNHNVKIDLRDHNGNILDQSAFNMKVNAIPSSPATEKVMLCMGDSLTQSGSWVKELRRRLLASDGSPVGLGLTNINFIGSKSLVDGTRYEGYGGWTYYSYTTANSSDKNMWITTTHDKTDSDQHSIYADSNSKEWQLETIENGRILITRVSDSGTLPSTGTLTWVSGGENHSNIIYTASEQAAGNPYWNSNLGRNDFVTYASQFSVNHIDHCIILLGWNSTGITESAFKDSVRAFVDSLLNDFPTCKITFVGLQVPSRDGMGENYGINWKYYTKLQHVWDLQKWYQELLTEYPTADYVCLSCQFDTEYNCITEQKAVNLRNSQTVTTQINAVHPAPSGYLQIADAVFRNIVGRL